MSIDAFLLTGALLNRDAMVRFDKKTIGKAKLSDKASGVENPKKGNALLRPFWENLLIGGARNSDISENSTWISTLPCGAA